MPAGLLRSSAVVTALSLAGLVAAFLLQLFLATIFGAGAETDAYLAAATIPVLVNAVFLTAMNITFIPVFIDYEIRASGKEAWQVANSFAALVLAILVAAAVAGSLLAEPLIRLVAPGLARAPTTLALAVDMQRILLPSMVLTAWSGLLASLFYAHNSFVIPTLAPVLASLTALVIAWLLADTAGIFALPVGLVAGNAAQLVFLLAQLRARYRPRLRFAFGHPGLRQIGRLMVPWLLGALIYKANPVVDRLVASQFSAGSISFLGYASQLAQAAVFISSKGTSLAVFPTITRLVNSDRQAELPATLDLGLRLIIALVAPILVLLVVSGDLLIAVIFQRGAFSPADTRQTAMALTAYAGSILALALGNILTYVFYALQDTKTPAAVGITGMALNLALALALRARAGFLAPAVSFSIMTLFNLAILSLLLRRRLHRLVLSGFAAFCGWIALSSVGMAGTLWLARQSVAAVPILARSSPVVQLAYHTLTGLVCYLLLWFAGNRTLVSLALQTLRARRAVPMEGER